MDPNVDPYSNDPYQYWDYKPSDSYYMPPPSGQGASLPRDDASPQYRSYSKQDFPDSYAQAFGEPNGIDNTTSPPVPPMKSFDSTANASGDGNPNNSSIPSRSKQQKTAPDKKERRSFFGARKKKKEAKAEGLASSGANFAAPLHEENSKSQPPNQENSFNRTATETNQKGTSDKVPTAQADSNQSTFSRTFQPITWTELPQSELYPLRTIPVLPEGWDWRIDQQNRLFYVDTYARGKERRCFWQPPKPEGAIREARDWKRVCNLFGRVYWVPLWNKRMKASYIHPLDKKHYYGHPDEEDEPGYCYMSNEVWRNGISEKAAAVRGELWWGNNSVAESNLKITKRSAVKDIEPLLQQVNLDGRNPEEVQAKRLDTEEASTHGLDPEESRENAREPIWQDAPEYQPAEKPDTGPLPKPSTAGQPEDPKPLEKAPTLEELQARVDEILRDMASKRAKQNRQG